MPPLMQTEKLTTKAQEALHSAQQLAHARSHQELDCDHLLLALAQQPESLIPQLLQNSASPSRASPPTSRPSWAAA